MSSVVELVRNLGNDLHLLGLLIFPTVVIIRLMVSALMKVIGDDRAISIGWRDVIVATLSLLLAGIFKLAVEKILASQAVEVWKVLQ